MAECGGLLYLAAELDGRPMCGVLPVRATMTRRLTLGYRTADGGQRHAVARGRRAGARARVPLLAGRGPRRRRRSAAWRLAARGSERDEGFVAGALQASFLHVHWAAFPHSAARLVGAARAERSRVA